MKPAPGVIIGGKYKLEKKLATGGQGSIWRARHTQLDAEIAIKLMDPQMADSPIARARFEREAQAAARIRHRNVVHVQDCGIDEGIPYLVMELFKGEDLGKRIRARKRMPLDETSRILFQVSKGLRLLHDAGYIHRDIKPGNIFITQDDEGQELVKLLDFGIIKGPGEPIGEHTKTGEFMGSPHYMSPEQIQGAKDIDGRSDLWSLGVVLFRMVTGQLPFPGEGIGAVVAEILSIPVPSARLIAPDLPDGIDEFFLRALMRPRDKRFQTVSEMAEAFGRIAGVRAPMPSVSLLVEELPSAGPRPAAGVPALENMGSRDPTTVPRTPKPASQAAPKPPLTPLSQLQSTQPISPEEMRAELAKRQADRNAQQAPHAYSQQHAYAQQPVYAQPQAPASMPTPMSSQSYPMPSSSPQATVPASQASPPRRTASYGALPVPPSQGAPPQRTPSYGALVLPSDVAAAGAALDRAGMGPMGTFMIKGGSGPSSSASPPPSGTPLSSRNPPASGSPGVGTPSPVVMPSAAGVSTSLRGEETIVGQGGIEGGRANSMTWWLVGGLLVGAGFGIVIAIVMFVVR